MRKRAQGNQRSSEGVHDDDDYVSGDAGASLTTPTQCSSLRKGGYAILKDRPCKIVEISTSKTGKHGHAKAHLVGLDLFSGKKREDICPATHNMDVPVVTKIDYQLMSISDGYVVLIDDKGYKKSDVRMPEGKLGESIQEAVDNDDNIVMVKVMKTMDQEAVVDFKLERAE